MDALHEDATILEDVTLATKVELVVEIPIDLLGLAILAKKVTENPLATHPQDLLGETCVAGSQTLSVAAMPALALCGEVLTDAGAGVDGYGLLDDETVGDELANVLSCEWK